MPDLQTELTRWVEENIRDLIQIYPELLEDQENDELVRYYLDLHCPDDLSDEVLMYQLDLHCPD